MVRRNLKVFRIKSGLTQAEFAAKIGVSLSTYNAVESGKRPCSNRFMDKLQTAFDIPDREMWKLAKLERKNYFDESEV